MSLTLTEMMDRYAKLLQQGGYIKSAAVADAFRKVSRHQLIEKFYHGKFEQPDVTHIDSTNPEHLALIYSDRAFMTRWPESSSSTLPSLMAFMLELLAVRPGMRVLEIGTGTGYNAALIAELVGEPALVTTVDIQEDVVRQTQRRLASAGYSSIHILAQDGFLGYPENAPYDRIVATVGCSDLSPHWLSQLAEGGFMLIPLAHGDAYSSPLAQVQKIRNQVLCRIIGYSSFMAIQGAFPSKLWLSEAETSYMIELINTRKPDMEKPLFPEFGKFEDSTPGLPAQWSTHLELLYFLALQTQKTFFCWNGLGFGDEQSFVLVGGNSIKLYGAQAPALYKELKSIYRKWIQLDKPHMLDYQIEFMPLSKEDETLPVLEPNTWEVNRKFFRQIVRL